jgi:dynactin complex subunit
MPSDGKNNGSVAGHVYFQCENNYGVFVRSVQPAGDEAAAEVRLVLAI